MSPASATSFYLPTRDECLSIVQDSAAAFYVSVKEVEGFRVEMYDYRMATYADFKNHVGAFEFRGLTFIHNPRTAEWERHLALTKFFNVNEVADWGVDQLRGKKISFVADKRDGSMITFVRLPCNGKIVAKTKMSFASEQAKLAQDMYDTDSRYKSFVEYVIYELDAVPVFEVTSPWNQIVMKYADTSLHFLQARRNSDGVYLNVKQVVEDYHANYPGASIPCANLYPDTYHDLDKLLEQRKTDKDIEGYVVTFEDGQMAKVKTEWYLQRHGMMSSDVGIPEHLLIGLILDEKVDDLIAELAEGNEKRRFVEDVLDSVGKYFNETVIEVKQWVAEFVSGDGWTPEWSPEKVAAAGGFNCDRRAFAMERKEHAALFGSVMEVIAKLNISPANKHTISDEMVEKKVRDAVKSRFKRNTQSLKKAREFLEEVRSVNSMSETCPERRMSRL